VLLTTHEDDFALIERLAAYPVLQKGKIHFLPICSTQENGNETNKLQFLIMDKHQKINTLSEKSEKSGIIDVL